MKLPLSWLKEFIHLTLSPDEIGQLLTMAGIEVDHIEKTSLPCQGVVVGKIIDVQPHPNAENLVIAQIQDGSDSFKVVCSAPNCRKGLKTAFAKVGALFMQKDGSSFKIKQARLRGVDSDGMLCSAKELGLSEEDSGIIELPEEFALGQEISDLFSDAIFEISLTPNLIHCASVFGIARELSALTGQPLHYQASTPQENSSVDIHDAISITIEDKEGCPRYATRLIKGVRIGPSPSWMQKRLLSAGMRPINNVVDATNYVLLEYGQPLHAFDYDTLQGHQIVVKKATNGESFTTLDHTTRTLTDSTTLICDAVKPVALAGILGGLSSEVSENSVDILLESAYFSPKGIRKSSKEQHLQTESSKRFERGADPQQVILSLERATALIQELSGGTVATGIIDIVQHPFLSKTITCRLSRINAILGTHLAMSEVETIFQRLQFFITYESTDLLHVKVPTYRGDLHTEIDLIEEVARIYGYNHIPKPSTKYHASSMPHTPIFLFERKVRAKLLGLGLQEFLTCDLINPNQLTALFGQEASNGSVIHLLNPNSVDQSILRPSLMPGLLQLAKYNEDHQNNDIRGFEIGYVHFKDDNQYKEQAMIGILLRGRKSPTQWGSKLTDVDFFDLKGIIETLMQSLGMDRLNFTSSHSVSFHPNRQASIKIDSIDIGSLGEIHPSILRTLGLSSQRLFFAELNLNSLLYLKSEEKIMKELPQFPGSERDWTLTLKEETPVQLLLQVVATYPVKFLEKTVLLDIHRSEKLGSGLKNISLRFFYRNDTRTLSCEDVDAEHTKIVDFVTQKLIQEDHFLSNSIQN